MSTRLIDQILLPQGLRSLDLPELKQVAQELRDELIDCVAESGGHFASSLGATEIAVALHHLFDTPRDRLVWDVGHQAYVHKMLTGRRALLPTIRSKGGISGFLKRSESEYDCFGAGHAGTSISAAVGMAVVLQRQDPERKVVAIIGDGSIGAGMAFEALNHASELALKNLIVILNDNEMSISPNVGAISRLFSTAITSKTPTRLRAHFKNLFKAGYIPELVYKVLDRAEEVTQGFFSGASMLFESLGFRYIGPIDGNSLDELVSAIGHAKGQDVPVLIHARTKKGKGYQPAELDPVTWHGVAPFNRQNGEFIKVFGAKKAPSYTAVFADTLCELARKDKKIVGITAAMPGGTGLDKLAISAPASFFDVGICEQHAVTFASGMACEGYHPVCAIYSTFLQRAYDQVVHDVCLQNLPVVFAIDRAGVVGNDGETHQGIYDIAFLRSLPNIVIMSPKDENELRHMLYTAVKHPGPVALRYPRGSGTGANLDSELRSLRLGQAEVLRTGGDVLLIGLGPVVKYGLAAAEDLETNHGISCTVVNARFVLPLDQALFRSEIPKYPLVCTLEDHCVAAGFGSVVLEFVNEHGVVLQNPIQRFGVGNPLIPHASQEEQHHMLGFDRASVVRAVLNRHMPQRVAAVG